MHVLMILVAIWNVLRGSADVKLNLIRKQGFGPSLGFTFSVLQKIFFTKILASLNFYFFENSVFSAFTSNFTSAPWPAFKSCAHRGSTRAFYSPTSRNSVSVYIYLLSTNVLFVKYTTTQ